MSYSEDQKGSELPGARVRQLLIRQMEPQDSAGVALLITQLGYCRAVEEVHRWIQELDSHKEQQAAYVACIEEEIVGWIEVSIVHHLQRPGCALIGGLVVKDAYRGGGIGRRLCERAEAWSWQKGVETLRVTSRNTRGDAHRFYLRDGYRHLKTSLVFEKTRPE
jgi:GNAT superfamily N-acetyltransferase